jgi:hypothetical protein
MKIAIMVEGITEQVFQKPLRNFLRNHLPNAMPKLRFHRYDGRIPKGEALRRNIANMLNQKDGADYVIAITDVYTGTTPPDFIDAADAKAKMYAWSGREPRFFPHAAQHDFEAWLLPFWPTIQKLAGHNKKAPGGAPETVNHGKPPSYHIKEIFEVGNQGRDYNKPRDAARILAGNDLSVAVDACPELKAFVNRIISLCGGIVIP